MTKWAAIEKSRVDDDYGEIRIVPVMFRDRGFIRLTTIMSVIMVALWWAIFDYEYKKDVSQAKEPPAQHEVLAK